MKYIEVRWKRRAWMILWSPLMLLVCLFDVVLTGFEAMGQKFAENLYKVQHAWRQGTTKKNRLP